MADLITLPAPLDGPLLALTAGAFFAGGLVKGLSGFGLPLLVISVTSMLMPVEIALGLNVIPPFVLNAWQAGGRRAMAESFTRFWPVLAGIPLGIGVGAAVAAEADPRLLIGAIGAVTITFCVVNLAGIRLHLKPAHVKPGGFVAGITSGLAGALTTVNGPPLIMYLIAAKAPPPILKAALGLCFLLSSTLLVIAFASIGFLTPTLGLLGLAMAVPAGVGMWLGARIGERLHPKAFDIAVLVLLTLMGLNLLRRAVLV